MVSVTFADERIARAFRDHFGVGNINAFNPLSNPNIEIHAWACKGAGAVEVLERLAPHMIGNLRSHAEHILERDRERALMNGKN